MTYDLVMTRLEPMDWLLGGIAPWSLALAGTGKRVQHWHKSPVPGLEIEGVNFSILR